MKIIIKQIAVKTLLGVYEEEKQQKQKILIDLEIDYDAGNAPYSDDVADTLNYHPIILDIQEMLSNGEYELLERAVQVVGEYLLSLKLVNSAHVKIDKPEAPIDNIGCISVAEFFKK